MYFEFSVELREIEEHEGNFPKVLGSIVGEEDEEVELEGKTEIA